MRCGRSCLAPPARMYEGRWMRKVAALTVPTHVYLSLQVHDLQYTAGYRGNLKLL
jgi:hypothetical protein